MADHVEEQHFQKLIITLTRTQLIHRHDASALLPKGNQRGATESQHENRRHQAQEDGDEQREEFSVQGVCGYADGIGRGLDQLVPDEDMKVGGKDEDARAGNEVRGHPYGGYAS